MLRLATFGGLTLKGEGAGGAPAGAGIPRRSLALLALLAASGDQGLSRDKLLLYLWPESDEEHGRNALRQLIHTLRRDLGSPGLLVGTADLRLNPELIECDVCDFEKALAEGRLEQAALLYRGPFLDGFHLAGTAQFERWVDQQRGEYAGRAAAALESLARAADGRGEAQAAAEYWRRLATLDPLNGRYALGFISALAESGSPGRALQHARVYETLVREELGQSPDDAVLALAERLRAAPPPVQSGEARADARTPAPSPETATPPATPAGPPAEASAVGANRAEPRGPPGLRHRVQAGLGGRYALERELERRDGAARVFVAQDSRYGRSVVLKVLHPALASRLDLSRFSREIALTARLQHPAIVPVLDSGEVEGQPWYVSPYVEGESLRDRLSREGRLPVEEAVQLTREVAGALHHAHRRGVLHRDIKPENILLAEGHALVTNFGVARALDAAAGDDMTVSGAVVGSPAYMPPEQVQLGAPPDPRGDIYSLGCVLYEMLAGEPVFSGPTPQAILAKRFGELSPPPSRLRPEVPRVLDEAVLKAIAPLPADRFASAAELAAGLTLAAEAGLNPVPRPVLRLAMERPGPTPWVLAGLVALLAMAALLWTRL